MKELLKGRCPDCKKDCNFEVGINVAIHCEIYSNGEEYPFARDGIQPHQIYDWDMSEGVYQCSECCADVGRDYIDKLAHAQRRKRLKKKVPKWKERAKARKTLIKEEHIVPSYFDKS